MPGRLAGFFNDELKIGHFYYGFNLIILSYVLNSKLLEKYMPFKNKVIIKILFLYLHNFFNFIL